MIDRVTSPITDDDDDDNDGFDVGQCIEDAMAALMEDLV